MAELQKTDYLCQVRYNEKFTKGVAEEYTKLNLPQPSPESMKQFQKANIAACTASRQTPESRAAL